MNALEKLAFLLGYDTADRIQQGKLPLSTIAALMEDYYGEENANAFLSAMNDIFDEYDKNFRGDRIYSLTVTLENLFLELAEQNVSALRSAGQLAVYKEAVERYIEVNLPVATRIDPEDGSSETVTYEVFRVQALLDALTAREQALL